MKTWPRHYDATIPCMYRLCSHGIKHPDFDHLAYTGYRSNTEDAHRQASHECDGCCKRVFF
jgi:hypothetical protein